MSQQLTLLFVFGTRPECIKLAPLILEAKRRSVRVLTCFTGQHKEMALPILQHFKIPIDFNLELMIPGQTLNDISRGLFEKLTPILNSEPIDYLIVQGDTTTAATAALIGFQSRIPIIHIEAGLRTYNLNSPWPEEFNRRMIGLSAKLHMTPTPQATNNLLQEKVPREAIFEVGNTGIDALRLVIESQKENALLFKKEENFLILVTLHRRENFGSEMQSLMEGLHEICLQNPKVNILWPLHQNPNVKKTFEKVFKTIPENLNLLTPLPYFDFISAMREADLIVTDSGGLQEEAPFLGKPVLVCRHNTERPESVACGSAKLIGTSKENLIRETTKLISKGDAYQKMAQKRTPYGDGFASKAILDLLLKNL